VRPVSFLGAIYWDSSRGLIKVRIGLTLYDWLTPGRTRERYRVLRAVDALSLEPCIRSADPRGAGNYFAHPLLYPERVVGAGGALGRGPCIRADGLRGAGVFFDDLLL